jgi:predicted acetyltransferase
VKGTNLEIRAATADEMEALMKVPHYAFANNEPPDPERPEPIRPEWTLCAFDGDVPVATSGQFPFKMRFNGNAVLADGVTLVSTDPGYRRRGIVRELISGLLHQSKDNGVSISILWASMGAIYQRFGYGLATTFVEYDVEPRYVRFQFGERAPGHTKLLEKDAALPALRAIYRGYTADGSGLLHRGEELWQLMFRGAPNEKLYAAVYFGADDVPTAYCIYRSKWQELETSPEADQVLEVFDFGWTDIEGYRGIWEYLAGHDLANRIRWYRVPEDDPAPAMLLEPRMLQRRTGDGIWLRIVDVEEALRARGYDWSGEVTLGVVNDDICGWNDGNYRLASNGADVEVERLADSAAVDIVLEPSALAGLVSGHSSASWLARMGRLSAPHPERLLEIDQLFSTRRRPTCANMF